MRTLWGEHEQAASILSTKERMRNLSISRVAIVVDVQGVVVVHSGLAPTEKRVL